MAMSLALLGLKVPGIRIRDPQCTAKTFPKYFEVLGGLIGQMPVYDIKQKLQVIDFAPHSLNLCDLSINVFRCEFHHAGDLAVGIEI
jgi:hypothetical protein